LLLKICNSWDVRRFLEVDVLKNADLE